MALPKNINLNTDKRNPLVYEGLTLRQSEQNLVMQATLLNPDKSPYDLSGGKTVTFNEHKQNDKFVVDTNVKIVDASHGNISYVLNKQCFAASGEGWFEIISKDGQVVDSTQIFRMNVLDAANANIANTNYISKLDDLREQMQSLVDSADGTLKNELQNAQNQLNSNVDSIKKTYNDLTLSFQNQFKQAQDSRAKSGTDALNKFNSDSRSAINTFNTNSQNAINSFNSNGNKAVSDFKTNSDSKVNSNISNWSTQWQKAYSDFNSKLAQDQKNYEDTLKKLENQVNSDNTTAQQVSSTLNALNQKLAATSKDIDNLKTTFNSTVFAKASDVYTKAEVDSNLKNLNDKLSQSLTSSEQNIKSTLDTKANKNDVENNLKYLQGKQSFDKPNFNNITTSGIYYVAEPDKGQNYPTGSWGVLAVFNGSGQRIEQLYFADTGTEVFARQAVGSTWKTWTKISNTTTYSNQDIDNKINAHKPDLSSINTNISNLQGQYNSLKTQVTNLQNKEYIHVANNLTDAQNFSKAHPDVVVIVKGS